MCCFYWLHTTVHLALFIGALLLLNSHMNLKPLANWLLIQAGNVFGDIDTRVGNAEIQFHAGNGWSELRPLYVTNPSSELLRMETGFRFGFKSDHLLKSIGKQNTHDVLIDAETGEKTYGIMQTIGKTTHYISAERVAAMNLSDELLKEARDMASSGAKKLSPELAKELVTA